jgi:hypothetical protein
MEIAIIIVGIGIIFVLGFITFLVLRQRLAKPPVEIDADKIDAVLKYVQEEKKQKEEKASILMLKKRERAEQLQHFKQTREELKDSLRAKFDDREWAPLESILHSADKGTTGIYVLYNETKNKYYVGQAKALTARIKKHFEVEEMARDFLSGDKIVCKTLTATELGNDYRIDHVEKVGIEIFEADISGYNKNSGVL